MYCKLTNFEYRSSLRFREFYQIGKCKKNFIFKCIVEFLLNTKWHALYTLKASFRIWKGNQLEFVHKKLNLKLKKIKVLALNCNFENSRKIWNFIKQYFAFNKKENICIQDTVIVIWQCKIEVQENLQVLFFQRKKNLILEKKNFFVG